MTLVIKKLWEICHDNQPRDNSIKNILATKMPMMSETLAFKSRKHSKQDWCITSSLNVDIEQVMHLSSTSLMSAILTELMLQWRYPWYVKFIVAWNLEYDECVYVIIKMYVVWLTELWDIRHKIWYYHTICCGMYPSNKNVFLLLLTLPQVT